MVVRVGLRSGLKNMQISRAYPVALFLTLASAATAQQSYDLLLRGGHVLYAKNKIDRVLDLAITGGKIARAASNIPPNQAKKSLNLAGFYVVPGLVDIHVHAYTGTGVRAYTGDYS